MVVITIITVMTVTKKEKGKVTKIELGREGMIKAKQKESGRS